jgi:WhiB family redox-sensing transcriptional regulator
VNAEPRPGWWDDALCAGTAKTGESPMFPVDFRDQRSVAAHVCNGCPAAGPCLQYALDHRIEDGIWGGRTEKDRRVMRRQRQLEAANGQ